MDNALKHSAQKFVHDNLTSMLDLRKTGLSELQSDAFKLNVRQLITRKLSSQRAYAHLADDHGFVGDIYDEILGLGPLDELLRDDEITEIMVNGPPHIFVEKRGILEPTDRRFVSETSLRTVIHRILSPLGRRLDESSPMVDARLPDGSRFNAIIPPVSLNGPVVSIRKFSKKILSIEDLVQGGALSAKAALFLELCVLSRKNILISGGTGSGKTTLLNVLSSFVPTHERIITIEDTAELRMKQRHVISLEARPKNIEGRGLVSIRDLLRNALRMRPDRIIVGECRGEETLDMLQAMNTGHEGSLTTLHANSSRDALMRLEMLILLTGYDLPIQALRQLLATSIDVIVFIKRRADGARVISQITEICGFEQHTILSHDLFARAPDDQPLAFKRALPRFLARHPTHERARWMQLLSE